MTIRNFIIQFNGREGSSAIISALSAQKGVNVPLFEELDAYNFLQNNTTDDYPRALDQVFTTRALVGKPKKRGYLHTHAAEAEIKTTGFKWRVAGPIPEISRVLNTHNVTVFVLQRRSFLTHSCSMYVHTNGNKLQSQLNVPKHPHLGTELGSNLGADPALRKKLNQQYFPLNKRLFLSSAKETMLIRQHQAGTARKLARAGTPISMIFYEDFDENPETFITGMLAKLGHDITGAYTPFCGFEKVHKRPLSERIIGLENVTKSWRYRHYKKEYEAAIQATQTLCQA